MSNQRIAFVGCGRIADHYLGVYRDVAWAEVVTCVDAVPVRAERAAETLTEGAHHKRTPRATTDFADALGADSTRSIINTPITCTGSRQWPRSKRQACSVAETGGGHARRRRGDRRGRCICGAARHNPDST